jgi:hypothetical protein
MSELRLLRHRKIIEVLREHEAKKSRVEGGRDKGCSTNQPAAAWTLFCRFGGDIQQARDGDVRTAPV